MWFLATLCLAVLAACLAAFVRMEGRMEKDPLEEKLSADDFEIAETE